jgi:hypothetical protein
LEIKETPPGQLPFTVNPAVPVEFECIVTPLLIVATTAEV